MIKQILTKHVVNRPNAPTPTKMVASDSACLAEISLLELLHRAEAFGAVGVFSSHKDPLPNRYKVSIEFKTDSGITLEAGSGYGMEIHAAFVQAIQRAQKISEAYK